MWACDQSGPRERSNSRAPPPLLEGRDRAHQGDEGVGAGVEQVVVAEGAQGDVLGAVGPQRHAPRLLSLARAQRIVVGANLLDAGLGVVGRELAAHHLGVEAAGHERHAVHVSGQLQGEWFGDGDGLEQVLDAEQGALAGPGRRHRQQLGDLPGVAPRPQPVLQQVGGHQGQPPTAYLPHDHRNPHQPEEDGQGHAHLGGADRGVVVGAVGQSEYGHHRHDLREGEPQQHPVLGLHVSRYLVFSHCHSSLLTSAYPPSLSVAVSGLGTLSISTPGLTTAFITSSTTP